MVTSPKKEVGFSLLELYFSDKDVDRITVVKFFGLIYDIYQEMFDSLKYIQVNPERDTEGDLVVRVKYQVKLFWTWIDEMKAFWGIGVVIIVIVLSSYFMLYMRKTTKDIENLELISKDKYLSIKSSPIKSFKPFYLILILGTFFALFIWSFSELLILLLVPLLWILYESF